MREAWMMIAAEEGDNSVLDPRMKAIFDQMPGCWGCKDKDSVFRYANKELARNLGFSADRYLDVIGRTDFDMPCQTVNCADSFRFQDKVVMDRGIKLQILDIHPFADGEWKAYIFTKTPIYNRNKEIIGTILHGQSLAYSDIVALRDVSLMADMPNSLQALQASILLKRKLCSVELSTRESQCLFFFLRGKSAKIIAGYLKISQRTVETYIEHLKLKFDASNKFELFDKAVQAGFMSVIPQGLFATQVSVVFSEG